MRGEHGGTAVVINYMFLNFICDQPWRLKAVVVREGLKRCAEAKGGFMFTVGLLVVIFANRALYKWLSLLAQCLEIYRKIC